MSEKKRVHFIGIGGAGMSGIAKVLLELGYPISGSDLHTSETTKRLENMGALINIGHHENNIDLQISTVVVSSAIPEENSEVVKANKLGIPVIQRAEMLEKLMQRQKGIAIAGAHGKTTTSSMISLVFEKNECDPTVIVGGEINDIGGNAKLGSGEYLVAEADESDGSFLKLSPFITVVTNIENDHMDYYGTRENIEKAFFQFISKTSSEGFAVLCIDNPVLEKFTEQLKGKKRIITYGTSLKADYCIKDIKLNGLRTKGTVVKKGQALGNIVLNVPGQHNMLNALATLVVGLECGLEFTNIVCSLSKFRGAQRRFQKIGESQGIQVFDDYAHHPTELRATLAAAKTMRPKRVVAVFQPHRYTRTKLLVNDFASAFQDADILIVNEIYSAGEKPIPGVNAQMLVREISARTKQHVEYYEDTEAIVARLAEIATAGDLIITLGAGNIWSVGVELCHNFATLNV